MNWLYVAGGITAVLLALYLFGALLWPEKFS
jgi:K+-transporting ATPase KdpF subunit